MKTSNYNTFLSRVAGLIGVDVTNLQSTELAMLNGYFNHSMRGGWEGNYWLDLVNIGEARFSGNMLDYANSYVPNSTPWTTSDVTITSNSVANPIDGRITAALFTESSTLNTHSMIQSAALRLLPGQAYTLSVYLAPLLRTQAYLQLTSNNGTTTVAIFDLTGNGSVVSTTNCTAAIALAANGFFQVSLTRTLSASTFNEKAGAYLAGYNGSTNYFGAGPALYVWGFCLTPSTTAPAPLIKWSQAGETEIEAVYNVWRTSPSNVRFPAAQPYILNPDGIVLVGANSNGTTSLNGVNPLNGINTPWQQFFFVDYRSRVPEYTGADWSAATAYVPGNQVFFTDSASNGNYWKCITNASAGQSPTTQPTKWTLLPLPQFLLDYAVYDSYSQWLRVEGRNGAAELMAGRAQGELDQESDRQERQMGDIMPTKIQTHVSVQPR